LPFTLPSFSIKPFVVTSTFHSNTTLTITEHLTEKKQSGRLGSGREVIRDHLSCQKKQKEPCQLINSGQTARTVEIRAVPTAGVARRALPNRRPRFILHLASQKDFTKKTS
jgi:hypothetical protein